MVFFTGQLSCFLVRNSFKIQNSSNSVRSEFFSILNPKTLNGGDVSAIRTILTLQWPPSCPPVTVEFWCRPSQDGGGCASFTGSGALKLHTCIGERRRAQITIVVHDEDDHGHSQGGFLHISDLEQRGSDREKLAKCLDRVRVRVPRTIDFDGSPPCEHTMSLKLCLRDTIHAFYIKHLP
jgi:hypothetical protein